MVAYLSLSGSGREVGWGGRLFEAGRLLTFSAFRMGAYSRWALIRGWVLIRINTVYVLSLSLRWTEYRLLRPVRLFSRVMSVFSSATAVSNTS